MRRALLLLLLAVPSAAAQGAPLVLLAKDDGDAYRFESEGGAVNPTITLDAGATATLRLSNAGARSHSLVVDAPWGKATPCCQVPGENASITMEIPENATGEARYFCSIHEERGMQGTLRVRAANSPKPELTLIRPAANAAVPQLFTVAVDVKGITLGDLHLHYTLNGTTGIGDWDTTATKWEATAVGEGFHLIRVEVVGADDKPLADPAFVERFVFVSKNAEPEPRPTPTPTAAPEQPPPGDNGIPAPGVALLLIVAFASARAVRRR